MLEKADERPIMSKSPLSSSYLTPPHNYPTPSQSHYMRPQDPYKPTTPIYGNASTAPVSFNATPPSLQTQRTLEEAINSADVNTLQSLLLASCNLYPHMRKTALRYLLGDKYVEEPPVFGSTIAGVPIPTSTAWPASPVAVPLPQDDVELPKLRREKEKGKGKTPLKTEMVPGKGLVIDLLSSDDAAPPGDEDRGLGGESARQQEARRGDGISPAVDRKRKLADFGSEDRKFLGGRCGACQRHISRRYADSACRYHTGKKVLYSYVIKSIENGNYNDTFPGKSKEEIAEKLLEHKYSWHWSCCGKKGGEMGCETANDHCYEQIRID